MGVERAAVLLFAIALLFVVTAPAPAAVRSTYTAAPLAAQGTLRVESDADDPIVVACIGGRYVEVNGAPPDTGPLECFRANRIEAVGGPSSNRIDLGGIKPAQSLGIFRGVAASAVIDGGAGDDTILGPSGGLVKLVGGAGSDWIQGQRTSFDTYLFGPATMPERDTVVEPVNARCEPSYVDSSQPGLSYWTVPWDAIDFRALAPDDPVAYDERAPGGGLASHRNRTIVTARINAGVAIEAAAGGAGNDRLVVGCMGLGGPGDDSLEATGSDGDLLLGHRGNDTLVGAGGPDRLDGGAGGDTLNGGAGEDGIVGAAGDDVLRGGPGGDTYLFGLADGSQADAVEEVRGSGVDVLSFDLTAPLTVDLTGQHEIVARARGLAVSAGPAGGRRFEGVIGGKGNDRVTGHGGQNHFWSGGGTDLVAGGAGNDRYYVDWTASMPYWAYSWGEVWNGPFDPADSLAGRSVRLVRRTLRSTLRILELPRGGLDTIDFADEWFSHAGGGARLEGQVSAGARLDLTRPFSIATTKRVAARSVRRNGGRHLEGMRGTIYPDLLIGNAAGNVIEGRQGRDRVLAGAGKDLCLLESGRRRDRDTLRGCERIRRVDPDR